MTTDQTTTAEQPPAPLNTADLAEQVAYLEALAAEAKDAAGRFRAQLETEAGDEYRRRKASPTWRMPGLGVVSGKVKHPVVRIKDPADFLAWMKAHRPEDVETVPAYERVRPTTADAILKGCKVNADGLVVTAGGDELAGVEYVPGGQFEGIACKFDPEAKDAYRELARTALARMSLTPESQVANVESKPAGDDEKPAAVAAFLATPKPAPAADPWAVTA